MEPFQQSVEHRSLAAGKWGNLLMAVAGVTAAYLSHSDALLVDGLYSGVNFVSGIVAARISVSVARPADRRYPFGYDAQEALYVTFRSLVLLGVLVFAVAGAIGKIVAHATGGEVPELVFGPIIVYAVLMVAICLMLAYWHRYNWKRSGRQSELLRTESRAAVVDAAISGAAGAGLLAAGLLRGTALSVVVPVADAVIVLILCTIIVRQPAAMFLNALREIAGATADSETVNKVHHHLNEMLNQRPLTLLAAAVTKIGRSYLVVAYVKPNVSIDGDAVDTLWETLSESLHQLLGPVKLEVVITGRSPYRQS